MAENRNGAQRQRRQGIRYHAGDGMLYTDDSRSVFTDPNLGIDARHTRFEVRGNTAAAPQRVEPEEPKTEPKKPTPKKTTPKRPTPKKRGKKSALIRARIIERLSAWFGFQNLRRAMFLYGSALLVTVLAITSILLGLSSSYTKTLNAIADAEKKIETSHQENEALRTQIELMFSKREVEAYAENTLHMVKSTVFNTVSISLSNERTSAVPGSAVKPQMEQLPYAFGEVGGAEAAPITVQGANGTPAALPAAQTPDSDG